MQHCSINVNRPVDSVDYLESVIPLNRLRYLYEECKHNLIRNPGNVLEIGVYKGGSLLRLANALKNICPEYRVIGVDTFKGHPYTDGHKVHPVGKYADVDVNVLTETLWNRGYGDIVSLVQGRIEYVFESIDIDNIVFCHVDCDLYKGIKFCAAHVFDRLKEGAIMYFDDYGHEHCPGATKAIKEVFSGVSITPIYLHEDNTEWSCMIKR